MKVLIVEDETAAFESLADMLAEIDSSIEVIGNTESVSQTVQRLLSHPAPDLILMDIHLSDGASFLIFEQMNVETPIIFTTAYDEYAIEAFKVNSIDYLLKPIKTDDLRRALDKFKKWTQIDVLNHLAGLSQLVSPRRQYQDRLLVLQKDKLIPIALRNVSYFYTTDRETRVCLKDGNAYSYNKTLEQTFAALNPSVFYRANKQFIIARDSVINITIWFDSRLLITLDAETPERIYISKNRAAEFKEWMVCN